MANTIVIKTNALQATDVTIRDLGPTVPSGGLNPRTYNTSEGVRLVSESENIRVLVVDDAHGAGSSTIILNDGTSDIAQADALTFLDSISTAIQIGDILDVDLVTAAPAVGETLVFDGTDWVPGSGAAAPDTALRISLGLEDMYLAAYTSNYVKFAYNTDEDVSTKTVWVTSGMVTKLFTKTFTYNVDGDVSTIVIIDETLGGILTKTYSYNSDGDVYDISRIVT